MRHPYRALCVSVVIVGILLCGGQREAAASDSEFDRATLRGLPGVAVLVVPEVEWQGLTQAQLQTDVELRLRKARIRVLSEKERGETPGGPLLLVLVTATKVKDMSLYAVTVQVSLEQFVLLERDPKIDSAAETWNTGWAGIMIVGESHLKDIRSNVADKVDRFITAFLAVNPKQ